MSYFILWVVVTVLFAVVLGWLASKNLTKTADGRPRLNYKQIAFDAIAFVMTIIAFPILFAADFILLAEEMSPLFNLKTEAPYVFSFLFLTVVHVVYFYGLHYLSGGISELTYVKARERYEVERELKLRKEHRNNLDSEIDELLAAWELAPEKELNVVLGYDPMATEEENLRVPHERVLTADDINAGAAEADKIVSFPAEKAGND